MCGYADNSICNLEYSFFGVMMDVNLDVNLGMYNLRCNLECYLDTVFGGIPEVILYVTLNAILDVDLDEILYVTVDATCAIENVIFDMISDIDSSAILGII